MGASKFRCYVLWWRNCTIYLDYHKWVLQNFDALFYGGGNAPFIWTTINGCFKILDVMNATLWISFAGLYCSPQFEAN